MKKIEPVQTWTFIGMLFLVAILVNYGYERLSHPESPRFPSSTNYRESLPTQTTTRPVVERPSEPAPEPVKPKTPEELAAERATFLARYMNDRPSRSPGVASVAIVAVNEVGTLNGTLASILAEHIKGSGVKTYTSLFTPEFVSGGLFDEAFNDSPRPIETLELGEVLDILLLARQSVEYSTNPSLENVLTANLRLEVTRSSVARRGDGQTWTFTAAGAGFKRADAFKAAEERIVKQIATDTNIVISTGH